MRLLLAIGGGIVIGVTLSFLFRSQPSPVEELLVIQESMQGVPFRDLVYEVTGHQVLPQDADSERLLEAVREAAERTRVFLSAPDSPAREQRRINEVSRFAEEHLLDCLHAVPGLRCEIPADAEGKRRRSGYPDLLVTDEVSGRRVYLDPKLYEAGSETSSLRTFYFQAKRETSKIQYDAHHWLLGFRHDGQTGQWQIEQVALVDLHDFEIGLKVEFQGSNRDLYRPELLLDP